MSKPKKYTVCVNTKKIRRNDGQLVNLWGWHYIHVEASSEQEANQKAIAHTDQELEPMNSIVVN